MKINILGTDINIMSIDNNDFISLTDMLKVKDGDFFYFRLTSQQKYH